MNITVDSTVLAVFPITEDDHVTELVYVFSDTSGFSTYIETAGGQNTRHLGMFATATGAMARAVNAAGWGCVVEHLPSWEELSAP